MPDMETRTYPIEQLQEFSTRVFLHFGVLESDAHPLAGRRMVEEPYRMLLSHHHRGDHVSRGGGQEFRCEVVSETVLIRLRRADGLGRRRGYFVQCNQIECQYVDENKPPCPLHVGMFSEEIQAREEARGRRDE